MKLQEIAAAIDAHLKRLAKDDQTRGSARLTRPAAGTSGRFVAIRYAEGEPAVHLDKGRSEAYLAALDGGTAQRHTDLALPVRPITATAPASGKHGVPLRWRVTGARHGGGRREGGESAIDGVTRLMGGYTREQLKAAWDEVKNPEHWKGPVDCVIDKPDETRRDLLWRAVVFFTGGSPEFTDLQDGRTRVRAAGYGESMGA